MLRRVALLIYWKKWNPDILDMLGEMAIAMCKVCGQADGAVWVAAGKESVEVVGQGSDVPIEFGKGATLEKAFIGRQIWRRDKGRVHDGCSCLAVEDDRLRRAAG